MKRIRDSKNFHNYPSLIANMQVRLCVERLMLLDGFIRSLTHFKWVFLFFYSGFGFWIHSYLTIVQLFIYIFLEQLHHVHKRPKMWSSKWPWTLFCVYDFFLSFISVLFIIVWNEARFLHFHGQAFCDIHNFLTNRYKKM